VARWLPTSLALATLCLGCATPIGVERVDARRVHRHLTGSVLSTGEPSNASTKVLFRTGHRELFEDSPERALAALRSELGAPADPDHLFALAELSFFHGEREHDRSHLLAAALYAYAFLFPEDGASPDAFDPRLRVAADLYNRALTLGLARGDAVAIEDGVHALPFGELSIEVDESLLSWAGYPLVDFVPVAEFEVRGLEPRYREAGIGAPLAAAMDRDAAMEGAQRRVAAQMRVPATAFLRIERPRHAVMSTEVRGRLELYTGDEVAAVEVGGRRVPLEYEVTSSLAYSLAGSRAWEFERKGFLAGDFRPFQDATADGLGMILPYQPGQIPVVFVHGTLSSPARWAGMVNELINDPDLYYRYQFWFFFYNTGNPILYSAAQLRSALRNTLLELDPEGRDPELQRMVLVGHSQGGLVVRLCVVDSGDRLWELVSDVPFDELDLRPETREILRESLFFEPVEGVRRVVYIATPHRGSYVAGWRISQLGSRMTSLPGNLVDAIGDLTASDAHGDAIRNLRVTPSSVANMTPGHPLLEALAELPVADGVDAHSIVAVRGDGPVEEGKDGVVAYESAHLEGVASEKVVRSGHSTQAEPATINEVRRILLEHLREK
jgi:pimeloyl-ACP methyl ester carboxylesterase